MSGLYPSGPAVSASLPSRAYYANLVLRPAALTPGLYVSLLLGTDANTATDGGTVYLVTDQTDKKGSPLLVDRDSGKTAIAGPATVWAIY